MAYTFLQSVNGGTTSTGVTTANGVFTNAVTAGSLLVVLMDWGTTNSISSISDTLGNTYTVVSGTLKQANGLSAVQYIAKNSPAGANTITVNWGAAVDGPDVYVMEFGGFGATTQSTDQAGVGTGTSGDASAASITPTAANSVACAIIVATGSAGTITSGWTEPTGGGTLNGNNVQYIIRTSAAASTAAQSGTSGSWVESQADYIDSSGAVTLRPGPIAMASSFTMTVTPRIPIRVGVSGTAKVTGAVNPELLLTTIVASGTALVTGTVTPHLVKRPGATGTIATSMVVTPEGIVATIAPGARGNIGVTGQAHGTLGTPNLFLVTGTVNPEFVVRPVPQGTISVTGVVHPKFTGTLRPFAAGTITVSGVIVPRFNPIRPLAAGNILITGVINPEFIGGAPIFPTAHGTVTVTGTVNPEFLYRPGASGLFRTSGGTTKAELVLRPATANGQFTGLISTSGVITPERYLRPGATGLISLSGIVNPESGGTLRPQAFGFIGVTGFINVEQQPLRPRATGLISVFGSNLNFQLVNPAGPPVVVVNTSGYYVVEDVSRAFLVMYMQAGINYGGYAVYHVELGPFTTYQAALAQLMIFAAEFFPNP